MGLQVYEHLVHTGLLVRNPRYTVEIRTDIPQYYGWWCLEPDVLLRGLEVRLYFALKKMYEDVYWLDGLHVWPDTKLYLYDHKHCCVETIQSKLIKNKIDEDYKNSIKKCRPSQGY